MVITAEDLKAAGIRIPLLVGGAALSDKFTRTEDRARLRRSVCYAKDAMTGLAPDEPDHGPGRRARRCCARHLPGAVPEEIRAAGARGCSRGEALLEGAGGRARARGALPGPQGPRRAAPGRDLELHQPVHALRQAPGLTRATSRRGWRSATRRRSSCSTRWRRSSAGGGIHEGARRVAVLRSRARGELDPPVRSRGSAAAGAPSTSGGRRGRTASR